MLRGLARHVRYMGLTVECPCCRGRFRTFKTVESRPFSADCPGCGSRPRHRVLWLYPSRETPLPDSALRVLHFAPEQALQPPLRKAAREYVSADLESPRAEVHTDITGMDFADGRFDLVLCSHVLEHVPDDAAAMREMHRVLAPGGLLVVQTPVNYDQVGTFEDPTVTDPAERLRLFSQDDHVRVYGSDLARRLEAAGFDVTVSEYAYELPEGSIYRYGLMPRPEPLRNDLYVCR